MKSNQLVERAGHIRLFTGKEHIFVPYSAIVMLIGNSNYTTFCLNNGQQVSMGRPLIHWRRKYPDLELLRVNKSIDVPPMRLTLGSSSERELFVDGGARFGHASITCSRRKWKEHYEYLQSMKNIANTRATLSSMATIAKLFDNGGISQVMRVCIEKQPEIVKKPDGTYEVKIDGLTYGTTTNPLSSIVLGCLQFHTGKTNPLAAGSV